MQLNELNGVIDTYGGKIYSFCCSLTGNRVDADDLYQETFLKAIELCHRLDGSGNVKGYLMGMSVRIWKNKRKKAAVRNKIVPYADFQEEEVLKVSGDSYEPESETIEWEKKRLVHEAITALPPKIKIVICMYYTGELSIAEISLVVHAPEGTVKSRLHKGRKMIKEYLEEKEYEE